MTSLLDYQAFLAQRHELPDDGRWAELVAGTPVCRYPPDVAHGNAVLNLSRALGAHIQASDSGYACFELGLLVERDPDTVCFPAVSYFGSGPRFAESDKDVTDQVPCLIVELSSDDQRRSEMPARVARYLVWGVQIVWVIDPDSQTAARHVAGHPVSVVEQNLIGDPVLPGFQLPLPEVFSEPNWWR